MARPAMKSLRLRHRIHLLLAFALFCAAAGASAENIVVIVNKDNPNNVDRGYVRQIYTAAARVWPDGAPVVMFDQGEDSEARELFYSTIVGKSAANMRALWSQNIFTGRGLPPRIATPDEQMKRIIAGNRNAIGYIRASALDASVRVLTQ